MDGEVLVAARAATTLHTDSKDLKPTDNTFLGPT
jgi:hypothetical protein